MSNISQSTPKAFTKSQNSHQQQLSNQSSHHTLPQAKKGSRGEGGAREGRPLQHYSEKNLHAPNWDIPAAPPVPQPQKKRNNNRYQSNKVSQSKQQQLMILDPNDSDSPKVTLQHPPGVSKQSLQEFIDNIMQMESKFSQEDSANQPGIDDLEFPNITKAALENALVQSSFALDDNEQPADLADPIQKQISQEVLRNSSLEAQSSTKKYLHGGYKKSIKMQYNKSTAVLIQNQKKIQQKLLSKSASQNQLEPSVSGLQSRSLSIDKFDNSQMSYSQGGVRPDRNYSPEGKGNLLMLPKLPGTMHPPPQVQQQSPDFWKLVKPTNLVFGGSTNLKISISPPPPSNFPLQDHRDQSTPQKVMGTTTNSKKHLYRNGGILNSLLDDKNAYALAQQTPTVTIFSGKQIPIPPSYLPPQRPYISSTSQPSLVINPKAISHTLTSIKSKKPPIGFKTQQASYSRNLNNYDSTAANTSNTGTITIPRMSQPVFSDVQKKAFRIKSQSKNQSPELKQLEAKKKSNVDLPSYEEEEDECTPNIGNVVAPPRDEFEQVVERKGLEIFRKAYNEKTSQENSPKVNFNEEMEANMKGLTGLQHLKQRYEQEVEVNLLSIKSIKKSSQSLEGSPQEQSPKAGIVKKPGLSSTLDFTNQKMGMRGTSLGLELGTGAQMKMITKKYRIQHNLYLSSSHNQIPLQDKKSQTPNKKYQPGEMTLPLIGKAYGKSYLHPDITLLQPRNNGLELEEAIKNSLVPQDSMQSNATPKIQIHQPTSTLTFAAASPKLVSKYPSSTSEDKPIQQRVHFSDSVEVYSGKQFAPGPTPPTVVKQKKKLKERYSITSIKRILFSTDSPDKKENSQEGTLTASMGDYVLEYRRVNDEKMIERHNNDMRRIQLAEAMRMEQYQKKNQEIQENMAKQAHRNMNLERMKLVMSFVQGKQSEQDQKKVSKPNLLKFSRDLELKGQYVPSLESKYDDMDHVLRIQEGFANVFLPPGSPPQAHHQSQSSQVQQQQNQTSNSSAFNHESKASVSNVKYKLNIHLV
ncbi:hypothetical protein FGO68_gene11205 [Halteria grandinella]|uniref:Uncharacterized protein n=1 Tax=Halteria grandinella TaxID=5974 RepID=A0A8J8TAT4_HALGN|nr:hypothetical protein FGO68_gene11205 [Halteria grandinella]